MGTKESLKRVEGAIIPLSKKQGLMNVVVGFVAVAAGVGVFFLHWYWMAAGGVFVGLVFIRILGLPLIFGSDRLVIGARCLQELKGQDVVISQIPYANIRDLQFVEHMPPFIGINLVDDEDRDSYCKAGFGSQKEHHGFDFVIVDSYVETPKQIYDRIVHSREG